MIFLLPMRIVLEDIILEKMMIVDGYQSIHIFLLKTDQLFNSKVNFIQVSVEGNIGSGKSTLMKYFQGSESCETVPEPIAKWTNLNGHNALVSRRGIFFTINIFRL